MRKARLGLSFIFMLMLAMAHPAVASDIKVPTAAEAVRLALTNSSEAAIARAQLEAAHAGAFHLRAALLGWRFDGVVDDTLSESEALKNIKVQDQPPIVVSIDRLNAASATLAVRKALAAGGTNKLALEESRIQLARAEREYTDNLRQIALTAYEAYRQLELALIQYRILERSVALTQDSLDVARDQYEAGAQSLARLEEARLAHQEALKQQEAARRMLEIAWIRLTRLLGLDPQATDILAIDVLSVDEALEMILGQDPAFWPEAPFPWEWSLDELVALAEANRPEVQGAHDAIALAELGIEKVKLDRRPNIELTANATWPEKIRASLSINNDWVAQGTLSAWRLSEDMRVPIPSYQAPENDVDWDVGVRVTFNLWDAGAGKADAHRARQGRLQAELGLDQARHGVQLDVQRRHAEAQSAYDALILAGERVRVAHMDLEAERQRAALGISPPLQVDAATLELWQAVAAAISARFDYEVALLQLARAAAFDLESLLEITDGLQGW